MLIPKEVHEIIHQSSELMKNTEKSMAEMTNSLHKIISVLEEMNEKLNGLTGLDSPEAR